jgi:hypothetical protein
VKLTLVPLLAGLLVPPALAQDPPKPAEPAAPAAPAKVEYLSAWPKPADKDTLMTDIERLCKARTDEMGKLAHEALVATGAAAVPFLLDRYGREKDEGAHERLYQALLEMIKPEQTRVLAKSFESKYLNERVMALWRAGVFPDKEIKAAAEAAFVRMEKQGDKADPDERYAAALCACSAGSIKGLDTLVAQAIKRWDKKGPEMRIALEGVRGPEATAVVGKRLAEDDRKVKVAALRLLGGCGDKSILGRIKPLLDETDNSIRVAAINACLGIVEGKQPIEGLSAFEAIEMAKKWKEKI